MKAKRNAVKRKVMPPRVVTVKVEELNALQQAIIDANKALKKAWWKVKKWKWS